MAGKFIRVVKRYSASEFERAVDRYFGSIIRLEPLGRDMLDANDEEARRLVWIRVPTLPGLCLALGIDHAAWQEYADAEKHPAHAAVCMRALLWFECYLEEQLCTREKNLQGVIFKLQNDYRPDAVHAEADSAGGDAELTAGMSAAEKVELICAMAECVRRGDTAVGGGGDNGDGE